MAIASFGMAFNIGSTNEERLAAFDMYRRAFDAKKISEGTPPDGDDLHITMTIHGVTVLLAPGNKTEKTIENAVWLELTYQSESELLGAYEVLCEGCMKCSLEGPYPWATTLALVTDRFGVCWSLYYNE